MLSKDEYFLFHYRLCSFAFCVIYFSGLSSPLFFFLLTFFSVVSFSPQHFFVLFSPLLFFLSSALFFFFLSSALFFRLLHSIPFLPPALHFFPLLLQYLLPQDYISPLLHPFLSLLSGVRWDGCMGLGEGGERGNVVT